MSDNSLPLSDRINDLAAAITKATSGDSSDIAPMPGPYAIPIGERLAACAWSLATEHRKDADRRRDNLLVAARRMAYLPQSVNKEVEDIRADDAQRMAVRLGETLYRAALVQARIAALIQESQSIGVTHPNHKTL